MWIKLSKSLFNLEYNIYKCCCYLPPANSKTLAHKDIDLHDILHEEILAYQNLGEIIGDMNSTTEIKQEQWVDINTISQMVVM